MRKEFGLFPIAFFSTLLSDCVRICATTDVLEWKRLNNKSKLFRLRTTPLSCRDPAFPSVLLFYFYISRVTLVTILDCYQIANGPCYEIHYTSCRENKKFTSKRITTRVQNKINVPFIVPYFCATACPKTSEIRTECLDFSPFQVFNYYYLK